MLLLGGERGRSRRVGRQRGVGGRGAREEDDDLRRRDGRVHGDLDLEVVGAVRGEGVRQRRRVRHARAALAVLRAVRDGQLSADRRHRHRLLQRVGHGAAVHRVLHRVTAGISGRPLGHRLARGGLDGRRRTALHRLPHHVGEPCGERGRVGDGHGHGGEGGGQRCDGVQSVEHGLHLLHIDDEAVGEEVVRHLLHLLGTQRRCGLGGLAEPADGAHQVTHGLRLSDVAGQAVAVVGGEDVVAEVQRGLGSAGVVRAGLAELSEQVVHERRVVHAAVLRACAEAVGMIELLQRRQRGQRLRHVEVLQRRSRVLTQQRRCRRRVVHRQQTRRAQPSLQRRQRRGRHRRPLAQQRERGDGGVQLGHVAGGQQRLQGRHERRLLGHGLAQQRQRVHVGVDGRGVVQGELSLQIGRQTVDVSGGEGRREEGGREGE